MSKMKPEDSDPVVVQKDKIYHCTMEKPFNFFEKHQWNILFLGFAHFFGSFGIIMLILGIVPRSMFFYLLGYSIMSGFGITVGCHRLWAHRTFKAKLPLQIILMICQSAAAQYAIFKWCRDHRLHHKYVETDADPHDARRGFYFAHMGWLFEKEHPSLKEKEKTIDFTDLDSDPVVRFQTDYYWYLLFSFVFVVPISMWHFLWPEIPLFHLFCVNYVYYLIILHFTWLVNSAAHLYGYQPYDDSIYARENPFVALFALGEGWHNYHHVFPWDYRTAEFGFYKLNWSCAFIDFCALIGWAYDLKTVPENIVKQRVKRTGNEALHHHHSQPIAGPSFMNNGAGSEGQEKGILPPWGWGDKDIPEEHYQITQLLRASKAA